MRHRITVNRAPVLTLWAAVVAQRLGFKWDEALTLGRAVAGLNAYSKGVSIGIFKPTPKEVREQRKKLRSKEMIEIDVLHRAVPALHTKDGLRALSKGEPLEPATVERYLQSKFGDALKDVREAMVQLAKSVPPSELDRIGYHLYERFRPRVPSGKKGWGAAGTLRLDTIRSLTNTLPPPGPYS